nr:E3 ubiquitin-protein ligase MYCBP2 isoform X2 [Onthophagus taurus]
MPTKKFGKMPPEQEDYHKLFHELYKLHPDTNRKKLEWKKKKKMNKGKYRNKNKMELLNDNDSVPPPDMELPSNASSFAMFASVRLAVLDRWNRYANQEYIQSSSCIPVPIIDDIAYQQSDDSDDNDDISDVSKYPVTPHVVGLGLKSVFTLIKESRNTYPGLCTKALVALFNVLQNQTPESLRLESDEVCDSLFEILQDLATSHGPESSVPNNGTHLTALACACLLSLVVARGNTGKFLSAAASLIMCPRALSLQNIKMPHILTDLQRSVQSVFLGKTMKTDYFLFGVPHQSKMLTFPITFPSSVEKNTFEFKSMTCDGHYLFIFTNQGLFKVGTSYGGTVRGHVYMYKPDFYPKDTGTILYCEGKLYIKLDGRRGCEFLIIDKDSLLITGSVQLHSKDATASAVFSCGNFLGTITPAKEDGFLVRVLDQNSTPASLKSELRLDLARKCVDALGMASYDDDVGPQTLNIKVDEEIGSVHSGKEFGLLRTTTGKVYYCGKASALGLKQSGPGIGKWRELILPKNSIVKQIAVGHDGMHAILLTDEKKVYFVGTSRRGEDGDLSKIRRQPKPSKIKKMTDFDHIAQFVACNSGTTAIITVQGELRMFGKDASHNDQHGRLKYLSDKYISKVALGKAHGVAICSSGHVYTFGINNKFQCGRDFIPPNKEETVMAMDTCGAQDELDVYDDLEDVKEELRNQPGSSEGNEPDGGFLRRQMCPPNMHSWLFSKCMVCTVCKQCTGYSSGCHSSALPGRIPGTECGCGEGASGCVLCGCCKECSQLQSIDNNLEVATNDVVGGGANNAGGVVRLELMYREKANETAQPRHRARLQEQLKSRLVEAQNRRKNLVGVGGKQIIKGKSIKTPPSVNSSPSHISNCPIKRSNGLAKEHIGSDVERDTTRVASLIPAKICIPDEIPAVQVACGLHHSVVLLQNGNVYTFGSNQYGQLGCGDILAKASLQLVKLPCAAAQVAAGSNHTIILTVKGEVYTCGAHQKGQLGRMPPQNSIHDSTQPGGSTKQYQNPRYPWYATPAPIPNIGPRTSRKATWIGGSGDQTFIKVDECLISASSLSSSTILANKDTLLITPKFDKDTNRFKCLAIHKQDGECVAFKGNDQVNFRNKLVCLDGIYNVLWVYNPNGNLIELYNVGAKELLQKNLIDHNESERNKIPLILTPELSLPLIAECQVTRIQAAINLLCCLDTLTTNDLLFNYRKDEDVTMGSYNVFGRNDYQAVNRFESHGGGWGYSIHSVEAIRFMVDTDILLGGLGLFGGRGDYTAKIKLFDLGAEGGEQEGDGQLIGENDETPYDCAPRQKYQMMFEQPIPLQAHRWYVAWCQINGPSSDCGSSGQTMVTTEDQVVFYFKSSKKSNNGTDVNAGQIPQLLYRVITPEIRQPNKKYLGINDNPVTLSQEFSKTVTVECFHSLQSLLQWAWNTFKRGISDGTQQMYTLLELERLVYVCRASLRLLTTYTIEIYPNKVYPKKEMQETNQLAECIADVRTLLRQIMSDNLPSILQNKKSSKAKGKIDMSLILMNSILDECHETFVTCFHAFYPTAYLKWTCLCDLLFDIEHESTMPTGRNSQRLLSALLRALSGPTVRLRSTFPLLSTSIGRENIPHKEISPSDNNFPALNVSESHYYPLLVEQMSYKSQLDLSMGDCLSWKDVLNRLLNLISEPIRKELLDQKSSSLPSLTKNCCHLLARVVSELVTQCTTNDDDIYSVYGHTVHMTPPRFTRTNQSRTWNTGNGSPEAICLQVDRSGISIVGIGVYGGVGHYECDLEILEDQNTVGVTEGAHTHTQRWNCIESVKHCFESTDFNPDIAELKFHRPVSIKENVKYAIRLKNHGGKTNNGDGGLSSVKGSDNTTFTFSTCPLSFNGTTVARGQIPVILYQSNPVETARASSTKLEKLARQEAMSMTKSIVDTSCNLLSMAREKADEVASVDILSNTSIIKILLPLVMTHISSLANNNPRCAVEILNLIQEMLPHIAALNLIAGSTIPDCMGSTNFDLDNNINTTSQHYACVQSEHPYKPATVSNYRVKFPESVKWIGIEFDPNCSTVQPEDTLQLYVPSNNDFCLEIKDSSEMVTSPYWPVSQKFSSANPWPQNALLLPGNEVIFSLKTASDYLKKNDVSAYGFKAMVIGYEWPAVINSELKHLESELSFLGGMCAANMIKKDLQLPNVPGHSNDIEAEEAAEIAAQRTLTKHGALLSKGLALSSPPTVLQALDGTLPYSVHSNERMFLRDFVNCVEGTSGGRLAQWLQPGSRLDPSKSHVIFSREEFRCGWPAMITILTCDQYADVVYVNHVTVEAKAIPIDKKDLGDSDAARKMRRVSQPDPLAFGGLPVPTLTHPYEPTIRDKMCFHAITAMKPYQNYSFEELRFTSPPVRRSSENMLVRPNGDGSYSATWTPASIGCYSVVITIDGYEMEEVFKVEVKEPPQGLTPPTQNFAKKSAHQPSKLRKFIAKNSAGLRIRALPSLQSEQLGIVHVNGTIAFIDEVHNDDGVWLRLSAETIKQYGCIATGEAWCLQYNQHLGKTLLLPVEEPKSTLDEVNVPTNSSVRKQTEVIERKYQVIKSGASGHNVRSGPTLDSPSIGVLVLGSIIGVKDYMVNKDGCWVLLDESTKKRYGFNGDYDAWSLAIGHNNKLYLGNVNQIDNDEFSPQLPPETDLLKIFTSKGYNFNPAITPHDTQFSFTQSPIASTDLPASTNPFVFGDEPSKPESPKIPRRDRKDSKLMGLPKWFKDEAKSEGSEFSGVSVKELVKAIGESRANGNGVTPPDTPKRSCSPRGGRFSPKPMSRSSSPIAVPVGRILLQDSGSGSPPHFGSPRSIGISPLVSGTCHELSVRRGSNQSDTSALVSSITRDISQSPSQSSHPRDLTPSPSSSSHTRSEISPPRTPNKRDTSNLEQPQSSRVLTQTGTQTSPENNALTDVSVKGHFSIGTVHKEERLSPKLNRKDRSSSKPRSKRAISPANVPSVSSPRINYPTNQPLKKSLSPSLAESFRAIFAAFVWHEGIVHDAMACASYLKFHPTLPKQGTRVVTRHGHSESPVDKRRQELSKEEKARQRHSVEVANAGNYLHIQPSTLESLTRSAANASANRCRRRVDGVFKEDTLEGGVGYQTVKVLPPALKCLVFLWEQVTYNSLQTMAVAKDIYISSSNNCGGNDGQANNRSGSSGTVKNGEQNIQDLDRWKWNNEAGWRKKYKCRPVNCELCGIRGYDPITKHMKQNHPGCGLSAGGNGFGPDGVFYNEGWAGSCGSTGVASMVPKDWYLMCIRCRNKYHSLRTLPSTSTQKSIKPKEKEKPPQQLPATNCDLKPHLIMRNNALFLLDLASASDTNVGTRQRRPSSTVMPSVSERHSPPDIGGGPFNPVPPFQCLQALGADNEMQERQFYEEVLRRQDVVVSGQRPLSEVSLSDETDSAKGTRFHRSISMGTNGVPWSRTGLDGRVIMMRKRNNTTTETTSESESLLLCKPSPALLKLMPNMDGSSIVSNVTSDSETQEQQNEQRPATYYLMERPVMEFITVPQDLDSLQLAMRQALRKAMCRVYAMQALNWLLRSVTQPVCLHDLLWWFVTSLQQHPVMELEDNEENKPPKNKTDEQICDHPLSDITIAGESVHPLPTAFHTLLQTIADLMVLLPMGSALQQMAMRCWGIKFTPADHTFLHRSQVFSNISKILSRSEEIDDNTISMHESSLNQIFHSVEALQDLTQYLDIKASSRQAMVVSLIDGSTETFWESGDEDRHMNKHLVISCRQGHQPKMVCVHVDNVRDLNYKIGSIYFHSGQSAEDFHKLKAVDVDMSLVGSWITCSIPVSDHSVIKIELKGVDNTVRLRQICVLGEIDSEPIKIGKQYSATTIQQRNCEAETLRVFRLITSQVFGKLILGDQDQNNPDSGSVSASESLDPLEESNDLREHMVGILFSRSKLTHLQKQVIVHIVYAIKKETLKAKEDWEMMLCSITGDSASSELSQDPTKSSDTYCFEMLSMVLALSGSAVGRTYLSQQGGLLSDLLSLLHIGSARVQRQVTSLLRRMLPEIPPEALASVMNVESLPVKDFSIVSAASKDNSHFDTNKIGILDVFLSIIAKSLTLQVKLKSKLSKTTGKEINTVNISSCLKTKDAFGARWWLRGSVSKKLSEVIIHLIKDMASGKLSEAWANVTKAAIAQNILNLTQLSEEQRNPSICLQTPTLWMALGSLCVLEKDHVERLSSGQWSQADGQQQAPPGPTCTNHDDGETNAVVQCSICGNLCADCDRFLHLHRKTKHHQRQVCKEEEEAIKVDLHEGCGRMKLFWLLALADARTLKALVEYREGGPIQRTIGTSGQCRFCGAVGTSGLLAIGNVCADQECQDYALSACQKLLTCGHMCGGVQGEAVCLPCLHGCSSDPSLRQDADDMCMICFTEALSCAPAIQLQCGHVFHLHCCTTVLIKRWVGPRITFSFSLCPICKVAIEHPGLKDLLLPTQNLFKDVKRKALMRLEYEGLHTSEPILTPGARFFNDPSGYAMDRYAYYVCFKCNKAYYGGEARCDAEIGENYDPAELVCGACSDVTRACVCPKHGTDFLEYKCRYCCSVAVFFCFGTTHFCNPCHDDFQRVTTLPKHQLPVCPAGPRAKQLEGDECPLHVQHPPTGEEFALGCGVCRNAHTF